MQNFHASSIERSLRDDVNINQLTASLLKILQEANCSAGVDPEREKLAIAKVSSLLQSATDVSNGDRGTHCTGGLVAWQVNRVKAYIERHLSEEILIQDLSKLLRLSPSHFSRAFKVALGEAPHRYIIQRRLERAKYLLLATKTSLSELALLCGFSDQAHLCRMFGKIIGESPALWRRQRGGTLGSGDVCTASGYAVKLSNFRG